MRRGCPECNEFDGARLRVLLAELDDELTSEGLSEPCRIGFVGGAARAEPEVVFVGTNLIVEAASPERSRQQTRSHGDTMRLIH